jgi:hypothetical protein
MGVIDTCHWIQPSVEIGSKKHYELSAQADLRLKEVLKNCTLKIIKSCGKELEQMESHM